MLSRNLKTAIYAGAGVVAMTGLGFAAVPLYQMFCQVTGLGGTTMRGDAAPGAVNEKVIVAFDSNVGRGMNWEFTPDQRAQTIDIGGRSMAFYTAKNPTDKPITGTATFNVTPAVAGKYFTKIECFCFTEQTLEPGQSVRMPVIYYVDPEILNDRNTKDVQEITLSYTFYPVDSGKTAS